MHADFIIVLLVIGLEHFLPQIDDWRPFRWWDGYCRQLLASFGGRPFWDGAIGVAICVGLPALATVVSLHLVPGAFQFVLSVGLLLYCMGPHDLSRQVEQYANALSIHDETLAATLAKELVGADAGGEPPSAASVAKALLVEINKRTFAVLFWFVIGGPAAALVVRLSTLLARVDDRVPSRFGVAAKLLHGALLWGPARLLALGYALTGSMVHALAAWRFSESLALADSGPVLARTGLAALQIDDPQAYCAGELGNRSVLIADVRGLIGRTLFAWLTFYAALTIVSLTH